MSNQAFGGNPKNVALQERKLAQAQKQLERIEKMREEMARQVELEMQRLGEMQEAAKDFMQSPTVVPGLSSATPSRFDSQYDQFSDTGSNVRLRPISGTSSGILGQVEAPEPVRKDEPQYSMGDRADHWQELKTDPGREVYVSGYYYSSGSNTKQYEYRVRSYAYPIKVGDMVSAPVHPAGWHSGRGAHSGHDRRFIITDIYSSPKFTAYHDHIG